MQKSLHSFFEPDVLTATDYYPFGMEMPGRKYNPQGYRYGFNGMEKDDDLKGSGNSYTTLYRMYDSRLGRWLSTDPEEEEFSDETPYNNNQNNPIINTDPNGDCPWCITAGIGAVLGGVAELGGQIVSNIITPGKAWNDIDYADVVVATVEGGLLGLTGGLGATGKITRTVAKNYSRIIKTTAAITNATVDKSEKDGLKTLGHGKSIKDISIELGVSFGGDLIGAVKPAGSKKIKTKESSKSLTPAQAVSKARETQVVNRAKRLEITAKAKVTQKVTSNRNKIIKEGVKNALSTNAVKGVVGEFSKFIVNGPPNDEGK